MWATRNNTSEMLLDNYRAIVREVPKYYERLGKKGTALSVSLAEYMEGKNVSIDCLMDKTGKVYTTPPVEVLTGKDVGLDDYHHFARLLPPRLTQKDEDELKKLAIAGVQGCHCLAELLPLVGWGTSRGWRKLACGRQKL